MVRHRKTGRGGIPDLSELTLEEQMVELDERVHGGEGPMPGQWPIPDHDCGDAAREVRSPMIRAGGAPCSRRRVTASAEEIPAGEERQVSARHPHNPMGRLDVGDHRQSRFFADDDSPSGREREGDEWAAPDIRSTSQLRTG